MCKRVEEFRVGGQSRNEKTFEEFSEGVIEIYTSVGCGVCFVFGVLCIWVVVEKVASLRVVCKIPIGR